MKVTQLRVRPAWESGLIVTKSGDPKKTVGNAVTILQHHPDWKGLRYDEFRNEPMMIGAPKVVGFDPPKDGPLDDYSIAHMGHWLNQMYALDLGHNVLSLAALVASKGKGRAFHPVREYLHGLTWDGMPRLNQWLSMYANVEDTEYARTVGRLWMISAVARVMKPGAINKHMIILEGKQDMGKSTLLRRLVPEPGWFSDSPIELGSKDSFQTLRGKLIVEIPELEGFKGREATKIKSYISSPVDNFRKSFGSKNEDVPRQCVFAGTTNESHYFHDHTGNVRFWPVRVERRTDFDRIERDRDQLWAEAFDCYMDGAEWHITDAATQELARVEQQKREDEDVWLSPIKNWVDGEGQWDCTKGVTTSEVLAKALSMLTKDMNQSHKMRVGVILRQLGLDVTESTRPRKYVLRKQESEPEE